jgi:NAD-dependent SIR2 family protein deacetylase
MPEKQRVVCSECKSSELGYLGRWFHKDHFRCEICGHDTSGPEIKPEDTTKGEPHDKRQASKEKTSQEQGEG